MTARELYLERLIKEIPFEGFQKDIQKIICMKAPPLSDIIKSDFNRNIFYVFWDPDAVIINIKIPEYIDVAGHVHKSASCVFLLRISDKSTKFDKSAYDKLI